MSITLNAAAISTKSVGGVVKETNATDGLMNLQVDFTANQLTFTIQGGTLSGGLLTPGSAGDNIQVVVDLVSGRWSANNLSGTLSAGALNNLLATLKSLRNSGENFVVTNNVVAGTQVAWT